MATRKLSPFERAFAAARADGKETFDFNGKKYNTKRADGKRLPQPEQKVMGDGKVKFGEAPPRKGAPLYEVDRPGTRVKYENEDVSDMSFSEPQDRSDKPVKKAAPSRPPVEEIVDMTYRKGGAVKKMNMGGMSRMGRGADMSAAGMARRPMKKGAAMPKMKSGGFVRSADGVAKKGKTRAKMC
jgi:hypothetical protein